MAETMTGQPDNTGAEYVRGRVAVAAEINRLRREKVRLEVEVADAREKLARIDPDLARRPIFEAGMRRETLRSLSRRVVADAKAAGPGDLTPDEWDEFCGAVARGTPSQGRRLVRALEAALDRLKPV